ncbi:hypothetical protein AB0K40_38600 [Nonomuraea bangladeshensis]|uniref:Alpha/beta hydrolase n=1 Tax=Nonomuraea bangladeshensis TaxID=404385 RepID=A0ABV3HG00_9ACTN
MCAASTRTLSARTARGGPHCVLPESADGDPEAFARSMIRVVFGATR